MGTAKTTVGREAARQAVQEGAKPVLARAERAPELERIALGWVARMGAVTIKVTHLKEHLSSNSFDGELTISCPSAGTVDGVIEWGVMNLLAPRTREGIAKRLGERVTGDWGQYLDLFCREVVRLERQGEPLQRTDPEARSTPLRYLLGPMLPRGMPTLLYGEGGTGKSTLAAAVALSVESGSSVFTGWTVAETAPVLILDWEATREIWQDRLNAVARGARLSPRAVAYRACRRRLADDAEAIADLVTENGFGLVIVDAVNQAFGVAHAEADPAEAAIKAFTTIREVSGTDVTWLLIDHVTGEAMRQNGSGETPLKSYGSVSKQWLARQMFYLAGEREATATRQELVLKHTKANYSWKMAPLGIVIERQGEDIRFDFTEKITDESLAKQLPLPQRVLAELREGAQDPGALRSALGMKATKDDVARMLTALGRMVKRGLVIRLADGRYELDPGNVQEDLDRPAPEDQEEIG